MTAGDLKDNLKKLNNSMAFLIKHSQKLFRVIIDHTHDRTINNKKRKLTYVSWLVYRITCGWVTCACCVLFRLQCTCGSMPGCTSLVPRLCRPRLVDRVHITAPFFFQHKHTTKGLASLPLLLRWHLSHEFSSFSLHYQSNPAFREVKLCKDIINYKPSELKTTQKCLLTEKLHLRRKKSE